MVVAGHELAEDLGLGLAVHEQVDLVERREREDVERAGPGARKLSKVSIENDVLDSRPVAGSIDHCSRPPATSVRSGPGRCGTGPALRVEDRQRPQQHVVDQAEDGRVRADAQGEREHRDAVSPGVFRRPRTASRTLGMVTTALDGVRHPKRLWAGYHTRLDIPHRPAWSQNSQSLACSPLVSILVKWLLSAGFEPAPINRVTRWRDMNRRKSIRGSGARGLGPIAAPHPNAAIRSN